MKFTKMHGIGNDYVYVNMFEEQIDNPSEVARFVSDRHFGIGSDGLILIMPSEKADFRMRMFNSDGSESEMCGNGIRCVGKYVYDYKLTDKEEITIETLAGIKILKLFIKNQRVEMVRVDMCEPILDPTLIPVNSELDICINQIIEVEDEIYNITCVSMGNPHTVIYVEEASDFLVHTIGSKIEVHPFFHKKTNVEFVKVVDRQNLIMRVWERGAGETLACGTGACAVLVASVLNEITERKAYIQLLGGDLIIEWDEKDNHVYMTGPATKVFDGEIEI